MKSFECTWSVIKFNAYFLQLFVINGKKMLSCLLNFTANYNHRLDKTFMFNASFNSIISYSIIFCRILVVESVISEYDAVGAAIRTVYRSFCGWCSSRPSVTTASFLSQFWISCQICQSQLMKYGYAKVSLRWYSNVVRYLVQDAHTALELLFSRGQHATYDIAILFKTDILLL